MITSVDLRAPEGIGAARQASWLFALGVAVLFWPCASSAFDAREGGVLPGPLPLLPADNWWNADASAWPVDKDSPSYIAFINNGGTRHLHPDMGGNAPTADDPDACYGMPFVVVSGTTASDLVPVQFEYADESDGVDHQTGRSYPFYPIPPQAATQPHWIEGGAPGNVDLREVQDRHLLIVDADRKGLYELYNVFFDTLRGQWHAGSGAFFDLNTNSRRPDGWTSADAAGLAILPGLLRYEEVYDQNVAEIGHALRVTVRATDGYVYPAGHRAGSRSGALPMGARLRLKATVQISEKTSDPSLRKIFRALRKHGLIVADNGSDLFITGTYDPRWNNDVLNPAFAKLTANDFEVIQLGYRPAVPSALGAVEHLLATLRGNALWLAWDPGSSTAKYRVEISNRLDAAGGWQTVAETSEAAWNGLVERAAGAQFYRVLLIAE